MPNAGHTTPRTALTLQEIAGCLRMPLTSLLAAADLLGDHQGAQEQHRHLAKIRAEANALAASLTDLEDLERLQRGELDLTPDTFDLPALLRQSIEAAALAAAERGIEIRTDFATNLPKWVQGQPAHLQKLTNRLLVLTVQNSTLGNCDFTAASVGDMLHVVVQNQCGTQAHAEMATNPTESHQTIGFAFCHHLAVGLGGSVVISPRPQGGMALHLTLPLPAAEPWEAEIAEEDQERTTVPQSSPKAMHGRVLLVDDSRDHLHLIGHLLERAGIEVTTADNGVVALHLLEGSAFDLVLMDMHMPELDGFAATQELRRRGVTTPVLAMTVDSGHATTARCLAAGCNGHLEKPVRRDSLLRTLGMYLPHGDVE